MSKIFCIIDGMTDPYFQANRLPHLSTMRLMRHIDTTQGHPAESLGCILRLLGTKEVPPNLRGYAEALGYGIAPKENDLILRGSWYALDKLGRCCTPTAAPPKITDSIGQYYPIGQYKSLLVLPNMAASLSHIITFAPYECDGKKAITLCPRGSETLSRIFHDELTPNRCLILWGQSVPARLAPFPQRAAVICGTPIVKGIARLLNMTLIPIATATGDTDTNLAAKTEAALQAAHEYPFVLLHINGADEAAHRKNQAEKADFLQQVDATVLAQLLQSDHEIYVVADHSTDPVTGEHIGSLQPLFTGVPIR